MIDVNTAAEFLQRLKPAPWVLHTTTKTGAFGTTCINSPEHLMEWLVGKDHLNIYYCPCVTNVTHKKAEKVNVISTQYLQVDLDPSGQETPEEFRTRMDKIIFDKDSNVKGLPGVPPPSTVVMSGRGYQLLWRLKEPHIVNCDESLVHPIEDINLALLNKYGAPGQTQNIERILRLPGTVNNPDSKKVKKGAKVSDVTLLSDNNTCYSLEDFKISSPKKKSGVSASDIVIVNSLDELEIDDYLKVVIAQGTHPDFPKEKDNSRSVWQWEATCKLVEAGIDDGRILGILLDPGWQISACILERKDAEEHARKQVAKAHAEVDNSPKKHKKSRKGKNKTGHFECKEQAISWINKNYFGIINGGRVQFYKEATKLTKFGSVEAFCFELAPYTYTQELWEEGEYMGTECLPSYAAWRDSMNRRYYPLGFELNVDSTTDGAYNLWRGLAVEPKQGDWSLMRQHVQDILADGDVNNAEYILKWSAWALQNPGTPAKVALVFHGGEGIGKGIFANAVKDIFGDNQHGMRVQDMDKLVGKFNSHLQNVCLLFCDEAVVTGSKSEGVLKGLITERDIPIEAKGIDVVSSENHLHIIMASNNEWVVPAGADSRRFAVFNVPSTKQGDQQYFKLIADQLYKHGGLAAMAFDLLNMDLKGWHPERNRPETDALEAQRVHTLKGFDRVWQDLLEQAMLPHSSDSRALGLNSLLFQSYCARVSRKDNPPTLNKIAQVLKKSGATNRKNGEGRMVWTIPDIKTARNNWNPNYNWDEECTEWEWVCVDDSDII